MRRGESRSPWTTRGPAFRPPSVSASGTGSGGWSATAVRPRAAGRGAARDPAAGRTARARGGDGVTRVLVIEDNPDLAYGLRNNLEIEGYNVEVVADGAKGLARARSADP